MFATSLHLVSLVGGFLVRLLASVVASLQVRQPAFEQFKIILSPLAFLFPVVAAPFEEGNQFPQWTSKLNSSHDFTPSLASSVMPDTNGTNPSLRENTNFE